MDNKSFTSANSFPVKVLLDSALLWHLRRGDVPLRHLQLCPTNKCNLHCSYCSCSDRDKTLELSLEQVCTFLEDAKSRGCEAVTITGGGEPLLHPKINRIIDACIQLSIGVGLVTNGECLDTLDREIAWCRVSIDSNRNFDALRPRLCRALDRFPSTDWAFSYVYTGKIGCLREAEKFAKEYEFTHIRVVHDILNPTKTLPKPTWGGTITQPRNEFCRGQRECWVSMLRPVVAADGKIYPCCGNQYAVLGRHRDFAGDMGTNLKTMKVYDGSGCQVCYYNKYNELLSLLLNEGEVEHQPWV